MTFNDLASDLDKAIAPMLVALEKAGDQWRTGPNGTVFIYRRDASPLGFSLTAATRADQTEVAIARVQQPPAVAAQIAAAQAQIAVAAKGA